MKFGNDNEKIIKNNKNKLKKVQRDYNIYNILKLYFMLIFLSHIKYNIFLLS